MALVVIGGVAAGLSAATRARRIDPDLEIVVLEKGPVVSYGACSLPYFVEGRIRIDRHVFLYNDRQVDLGEDPGDTDIREALGDKFNYDELMRA